MTIKSAMTTCMHCGSHVPDGASFCPGCGASLSSVSQMPTAIATPDRSAPRPTSPSIPIGRLDNSSSPLPPVFTAGQVLAGRYRIIGLLGRGGMGEVYRADDLTLGQPVSLKFLPRHLAQNPALLERFRAEVRNARQVSHPNVCRVYDIGEIDGQHFLSMEYVDGEDLAVLLRRIGRLPEAKAHEVVRQLCAGLAAAHDKGVLHRDLKPSNVMIDGHGRAKITDFGLAVRTDEMVAGDIAGTPAYMAPEQFEGRPVTAQSDLYSLGLIMYEIYTGTKPFEAASMAEWKSRHMESHPTLPSEKERHIDEAVERSILRCLEKDPAKRPASALQLAAALPGGDPLAAALAAGETPSPEMVAAAGGEGAMSMRAAGSFLAGVLAILIGILFVAPYGTDLGLAPMTKSADVLRDRARQILTRFELNRNVRDSESWFTRDYGPMRYLADHVASTVWRPLMRNWGAPVLFMHRESPRWMSTDDHEGRIDAEDPPVDVSGMSLVALTAAGNLRALTVEPSQFDSTTFIAAVPDWDALFEWAGLERATFQPVAQRWVPASAFDAREEWTGPAPWARDVTLRVSAASFHGMPVHFEVLGPWSRPFRQEVQLQTGSQRVRDMTLSVSLLLLLGSGFIFARRNLRLGRGDRRGALRFAAFLFGARMLSWVAGGHHVPSFSEEIGMLLTAVADSLLLAAFTSILYIALEPYVRRRMPELLIGWVRLLEGRFRDPRVGRDVLAGILLGGLIALIMHVTNALPTWVPLPAQTTLFPNYDVLYGGRRLLAALLSLPTDALPPAMTMFCALFVLRLVLRKPSLALGGLVVFLTLMSLGGENVMLETPGAVLIGIVSAIAVARFGLLTAVVAMISQFTLTFVPLPLGPGAPYTASTVIVLGLIVGITCWAFRVAIGPRPLFAAAFDD